ALRAGAPPRRPSRGRRAPAGSRSRARGRRCARAACAPIRAAPAGSPHSRGCRRTSCCLLPLDTTQDAVHELCSVVGRVPLGEGNGLVDRHLGRHVVRVELVDGDAKRTAFDDTEAVGRPALGGAGDALVELGCAAGDGLGDLAGPWIDLACVLRADRLTGEIPLVEQEQRLAARLASRERHQTTTERSDSSVDVEYSPLLNWGLASTSSATSRVVGIPSTTVSRSARSARAIAASRFASHTTSLAIIES